MSSLVRLAAWMPATRAVASPPPLGRPPAEISATTSGVVTSAPAATAVRLVTAFAVTSTMWAAPCSSRWESRPASEVTAICLLVDHRNRMGVREIFGRHREGDVPERRQRAGAIGGELTDGVVVLAVRHRPAVVDVWALLRFVVSHPPILTGETGGRDTDRLLYAGQQ